MINQVGALGEESLMAESAEQVRTFDEIIEAALVGDEPLEVVYRPIEACGNYWIVTLTNYPHVVVFASLVRAECDTVVSARKLPEVAVF
jgi:hypothetical protein